MGAEVSSSKDLQLDEELPLTGDHGWTINNARGKDGTRATVFRQKSSTNYQLLQNAATQLKRLRHPSVLKFVALTKSSLVTEHVSPLEMVLDDLSATEIAGGVHNILEALIFLHDRGGLTHNNVCMSSVFVADDGGWRLGGMEHVCTFQEATGPFLASCKPLRNEAAISPEEKAGKVDTCAQLGHARDVYAFGILAEDLLESLSELGDMTKTFELRIQDELLHPDAKMRPHLRTLTSDRLFRNEFLEIVHFLQHITLKSEEEKKVFFNGLVKKLYDLPSTLVASRLARPLLSRFVLLDATALSAVIPHLLTPCGDTARGEFREGEPNPVLTEVQFRQSVVPELYKIFHVRDAHIRIVLLSRFPQYVRLFDRHSLEKVILPQILLGLRDTNDALVKASLLALSELVPILGGDIVIGTHRSKIFSEGVPKEDVTSSSAVFTKAVPAFHSHDYPRLVPRGKQELSIICTQFGNRGCVVKTSKQEDPIYEQRGNGLAPCQNEAPNNKVTESQTLKELAKEHNREKRKEDIKIRNKERRRKREEKSTVEIIERRATDDTPPSDCRPDNVEERNELNQMKPGDQERQHRADWEDSRGRDSDYEREIEEELKRMAPAVRPAMFDSVERAKSVKTVWSDVQSSSAMNEEALPSKTRGMLKLKSKSKSSPPPKLKMAGDPDWVEGDWGFQDGDIGTVTPRKSASPKVHSSRSRPPEVENDGWGDGWGGAASPSHCNTSPSHCINSLSDCDSQAPLSPQRDRGNKPARLRPHAPSQELGSEFDIRSITVKNTSSEPAPDFFSDMEPVIRAKNPLAELVERSTIAAESGTSSKSRTGALSFAVVNAEETAAGWGDDGWGEEEGIDVIVDS